MTHSAVAINPPLMTGWQTGFYAEGTPEPPPGQQPAAEMTVVSNDYLQTIGATLLRGRMFDAHDQFESAQVAIIDQLLADKYFPGQNPIGKRLKMNVNPEHGRQWRTIVGVVPHLKVYGFEEQVSLPQVLLPLTQSPQNSLVVLLRSSLPPQALEEPLRKASHRSIRRNPSSSSAPWKSEWRKPGPRHDCSLSCLAFSPGSPASSRWSESTASSPTTGCAAPAKSGCGWRSARGARQIVSLILGQGVRLLAVGLVVGFAAAFALSRVMRSLLFGVSATDPLIFFAVSLLLGCAAVIACWIPAHRASRVDPIITLRAE